MRTVCLLDFVIISTEGELTNVLLHEFAINREHVLHLALGETIAWRVAVECGVGGSTSIDRVS